MSAGVPTKHAVKRFRHVCIRPNGRMTSKERTESEGMNRMTVARRGRTYRLTRMLFPGRDYRRLDVTGAWDDDCYAAYTTYGCTGVLWHNRAGARPPDVAKLPGLKWLEVEGATRDLSWVSQCSNLVSLAAHFRVNKGGATSLTIDVTQLTGLRHLMIGGCRVRGVEGLRTLETLDLEVFDQLDPDEPIWPDGLLSSPSIIRIAAASPLNMDLDVIASPQLEELRLSPARLRWLGPLRRCTALTTLDLTLPADASPLDVAPLRDVPTLATVVIRGDRPVTGLESLAAGPALRYAQIGAPRTGPPPHLPEGWTGDDQELRYAPQVASSSEASATADPAT